MSRIFLEQLKGIEFIAASHGKKIVIPEDIPHQIVRDKITQDDVGIVIFNGNREDFPYRISAEKTAYIFWKGSSQTVAFGAYAN